MSRRNRPKVELTCENCGKKFLRGASEYKRCLKRGYSVACGRSCGATIRNLKFPTAGNPANLTNNKNDELSKFRFLSLRMKGRARRNLEFCDVSAEDIKRIYDVQQGLCVYTGIKMLFPCENTLGLNSQFTLYNISVDRIDSSKEYTKDNIELVCLGVNFCKNAFSKAETIEFFNKVRAESAANYGILWPT